MGCEATKLMRHNYSACALERGSHNYWAHPQQLLKPTSIEPSALQQKKPQQWEAHLLQLEKAQAAMKSQHSKK